MVIIPTKSGPVIIPGPIQTSGMTEAGAKVVLCIYVAACLVLAVPLLWAFCVWIIDRIQSMRHRRKLARMEAQLKAGTYRGWDHV